MLHHAAQLHRLDRGNGVGIERDAGAAADKFERFYRQVRVEHQRPGLNAGQDALKVLRAYLIADGHVVYGKLHVAALVGNIEIARTARAGYDAHTADVHTEAAAAVKQELTVGVVADGGDKADVKSKQAEVVRDVAPDTAWGERH